MDIIDILIAQALSPQASVGTYAAQAHQAAVEATQASADAAQAISDANTAIDAVKNINDLILFQSEQPTSSANKIWINSNQTKNVRVPAMTEVEDEIEKLALELYNTSSANAISSTIRLVYPNSSQYQDLENIVKYYTTVGNNTDGTMTQAAITAALSQVNTNLGAQNANSIVKVDSNGNLAASDITEQDLYDILDGHVSPISHKTTVGLYIDYPGKTFQRQQDALGLTAGSDFDQFLMYGGRKRCNVADDGTITAFYGQSNYTENGSNGQVMVYQPKFYYKRVPSTLIDGTVGRVVQQETLYLSTIAQTGFKLHPLFITPSGAELEYVLLPAYESTYYDSSANIYNTADTSGLDIASDKLASIANVKPLGGINNTLTIDIAEQLAQNRGSGWHITNLAAESALQMLFMVEYGALNGQTALEDGICNLSAAANVNFSSQTGSTASLGNGSGAAAATTNITNNTTTTGTTAGTRAISYRGMENPWGNTWRFIGGLNISGDGTQDGGIPYVCSNFNYNTSNISDNYHSVGFSLPTRNTWISGVGYGESDYDWVFMPAQIGANNANSALPIGDSVWVSINLNGINIASIGGKGSDGLNCGLFYYACDQKANLSSRCNSARLMYIPNPSDTSYQTSYNAWKQIMGV